eukprot:2403642-Alexandrium_andersonii.AAC.1
MLETSGDIGPPPAVELTSRMPAKKAPASELVNARSGGTHAAPRTGPSSVVSCHHQEPKPHCATLEASAPHTT